MDLKQLFMFIMEILSWVTEDFLWEHEWVTESTPVGTDVVFRSVNLNRSFVNNGTKVSKLRETVNNAIVFVCNIVFEGIHTPRACVLRAAFY